MGDMNNTTTIPQVGDRVILLTKPYRDSEKTNIEEVTLLEISRIGDWIVEKKPGSVHCFMNDIILEWSVEVAK